MKKEQGYLLPATMLLMLFVLFVAQNAYERLNVLAVSQSGFESHQFKTALADSYLELCVQQLKTQYEEDEAEMFYDPQNYPNATWTVSLDMPINEFVEYLEKPNIECNYRALMGKTYALDDFEFSNDVLSAFALLGIDELTVHWVQIKLLLKSQDQIVFYLLQNQLFYPDYALQGVKNLPMFNHKSVLIKSYFE